MKITEIEIRAALAAMMAVQSACLDDSDDDKVIARVREAANGRINALRSAALRMRHELNGMELRRTHKPQPETPEFVLLQIATVIAGGFTDRTYNDVIRLLNNAGYAFNDDYVSATPKVAVKHRCGHVRQVRHAICKGCTAYLQSSACANCREEALPRFLGCDRHGKGKGCLDA